MWLDRRLGFIVAVVGFAPLVCLEAPRAATPATFQRAAAGPFEVDRLWPKPLGHGWILGSVTGVAVDARDHIWLVHRGLASLTARTEAGTGTTPPTAETCCAPAPFVLEFDPTGTVVGQWGGQGQGYDWPVSPGGIAVGRDGDVWIAAAGPPDVLARGADSGDGPVPGERGRARGPAPSATPADAHVLKFSRTGQFLLQIGHPGRPGTPTSTTDLDRPADVAVDASANEVYVADGGSHQRIAVFDATSGAFKRQWAGHDRDFARVSCVSLSKDGFVYVCDRTNDRLQVFRKDGTFVKEGLVSATTKGLGSVWDVAFSPDAAQRFVYVADGQDQKIWVLQRETLDVAGSFGSGGRWPGYFFGVGSVAVDSKGNVYTGETYEGKRLQKFLQK
jgi:hypothetical protein